MITLLLTTLALAALPPEAQDSIYDEYEGVKLAEALHRDGKGPAALKVLEDLSPADRNSPEGKKVLGDVHLTEGRLKEAIAAFKAALPGAPVPLGQTIHLQLAKAYLRTGERKECAKVAEAAGEKVYEQEESVLVKARCEWAEDKAYSTLERGIQRLGTAALHLEKIRFLLSRKLVLAAYEAGVERVKQGTPSEILSLAEVFAQNELVEESLKLLETGRLLHPADTDISLGLAPLYHRKGWLRATLEAFERASLKDNKYAEHSAELNRQLGSVHRARMFQPLIPGEKERVRHNLALSVESGRWELVSSLDPAVKRAGLLEDDEVNYALAFSLARLGNLDRSEAYLSRIRSPGLLGKAAALRKVIEECAKTPCQFLKKKGRAPKARPLFFRP